MQICNKLQVTLALFKPNIAANPYLVGYIEKRILKTKFFIVKQKYLQWNKENAEEFYADHKGKFFYPRLVDFMTSGPIIALVLARDNAIVEWRKLMGPTKVFQTQFYKPNTIRGQFGLTDTRNTVHGSDSVASVNHEVPILFPEFNLTKWYKDKAKHFASGQVVFDRVRGIHRTREDYDRESILLHSSPDDERLSLVLGEARTWTNYYSTNPAPKDWFVGYRELKEDLSKLCSSTSCKTVVDVGCGSSTLGMELATEIPHLNVYCVDISLECLRQLSVTSSAHNCTFILSDVCRRLPFDDNSVDLIIDKGTSDAVVRQEDGPSYFISMINEVERVLRKEGILLQITTEAPETRLNELGSIAINAKTVSYSQLQSTSNNLPVFVYRVTF